MTKLSYTLGMKVFACFIAVLSGITAFFDGIGIFLANSYDFYSSSLAELKLAHPYLDTGMLTKLYGMRGSLLPILVISLLLFAISVIYLLCAAGHRPDTDEIVPNLQDKIPLDLYFAIVCPILLAILFLILEGRNPLADTGALSFVVIGSIILAILGLATLLTCVTRLKLGRYFYQHTIAYQVIRFCWKMLAAVTGERVPQSIAEKKALLLRNHIALHDVIHSCDIIGSSDSSIKNVEPADLERILAVTGRVAILCNGGMSYKLYRKYQESRLGIPAVQLPSTSPANAAWNLERLSAAWGEVLLPLLRKEEE